MTTLHPAECRLMLASEKAFSPFRTLLNTIVILNIAILNLEVVIFPSWHGKHRAPKNLKFVVGR